ncbi:MAG: hypothetical protein ACM3YO_06885 [Bacteroidota bacterium]
MRQAKGLPLIGGLMISLMLLGAVPAHPVVSQAIILRDGGTILVEVEPSGRFRLDRAFGSPTRGEFFYESEKKDNREKLSREDLRKLYPELKGQTVKKGEEYYRVFVEEMGKRLNTPAGNRSRSSAKAPARANPGVRRSP